MQRHHDNVTPTPVYHNSQRLKPFCRKPQFVAYDPKVMETKGPNGINKKIEQIACITKQGIKKTNCSTFVHQPLKKQLRGRHFEGRLIARKH